MQTFIFLKLAPLNLDSLPYTHNPYSPRVLGRPEAPITLVREDWPPTPKTRPQKERKVWPCVQCRTKTFINLPLSSRGPSALDVDEDIVLDSGDLSPILRPFGNSQFRVPITISSTHHSRCEWAIPLCRTRISILLNKTHIQVVN